MALLLSGREAGSCQVWDGGQAADEPGKGARSACVRTALGESSCRVILQAQESFSWLCGSHVPFLESSLSFLPCSFFPPPCSTPLPPRCVSSLSTPALCSFISLFSSPPTHPFGNTSPAPSLLTFLSLCLHLGHVYGGDLPVPQAWLELTFSRQPTKPPAPQSERADSGERQSFLRRLSSLSEDARSAREGSRGRGAVEEGSHVGTEIFLKLVFMEWFPCLSSWELSKHLPCIQDQNAFQRQAGTGCQLWT